MSRDTIISLRDITKTYDMGLTQVHALQGVSVEIAANEYVAIMGPSGSGKSTLMNIIGCLDVPTAGVYELNGQLVSEMDDDELARVRNQEIGFVFQTFHLLPRSDALRNVELPLVYGGLGAAERRERAMEALAAVGLGDRVHHRPNELSGGQRQRVAVARALSNHPSIILADEPTGALDSQVSQEIMDIFLKLSQEQHITTVMVTHDPKVGQQCQRTVRMADGRLAPV